MKSYFVDGKEYYNICDVHRAMGEIFNKISSKKIEDFNENFINEIIKECKIGYDLSYIALDMGMRMEGGLEKRKGIVDVNYVSFLKLGDTNDDDDEAFNFFVSH